MRSKANVWKLHGQGLENGNIVQMVRGQRAVSSPYVLAGLRISKILKILRQQAGS